MTHLEDGRREATGGADAAETRNKKREKERKK